MSNSVKFIHKINKSILIWPFSFNWSLFTHLLNKTLSLITLICLINYLFLPDIINISRVLETTFALHVIFTLLCSVAKSYPTLWSLGLQHARFLCPLFPGVYSNSCALSCWYYPTISSSASPSPSFSFIFASQVRE